MNNPESSMAAEAAAREILYPDGKPLEGYGADDVTEVANIILRHIAAACRTIAPPPVCWCAGLKDKHVKGAEGCYHGAAVSTPRCPTRQEMSDWIWSQRFEPMLNRFNLAADGERILDTLEMFVLNFFQPAPSPPQWISTEERLPELGTVVLVWRCGQFNLVEYSAKSQDYIRLIRRDGQWWHDGKRITHWQPLPAAPSPQGESK